MFQLKAGGACVILLEGRDEILERASLLEEYAAHCGQPAAMNWLAYFLDPRQAGRKRPRLMVLADQDSGSQKLSLNNIQGVALFFEYIFLGLRTGAFSVDDSAGIHTVVAPANMRAVTATLASQALMEDGAHVVQVTHSGGYADGEALLAPQGPPNALWARRQRSIGTHLRLEPTLEATLAALGKSTRFNLGYYRRRLLDRMNLEFLPDARAAVQESELDGLNLGSLNPVSAAEFKLRWECACTLPGSFLLGLRGQRGAGRGTWMSFIGGWRQGTTTVLQWQSNTAGYEKASIGTVMRSYFLENEVRLGQRKLIFYGGTPHSLQHSFRPGPVWDLVMRRRSLRASLIRMMSRLISSPRGLTGRTNFLAEVLWAPELRWRAVDGRESTESSPLHGSPVHSSPAQSSPVASPKIAADGCS